MALSTALAPRAAQGAIITLQGMIGPDDALQLFNVTVATVGSVDFRSYGYAAARRRPARWCREAGLTPSWLCLVRPEHSQRE